MVKKRTAWCVVGSIVLLVTAGGIVASMAEPEPERLRREAKAAASDYGFVHLGAYYTLDAGDYVYDRYEAKGLDRSDIERIAQRLDSACKGCKRRESKSSRGGTEWSSDSKRLRIHVHVYKGPGAGVVSMVVSEST